MTPYLILHKVRGEPAFDVAVKMEMADGPWWIIPTSGHRAYPYWHEAITVEGYLDHLLKNPPVDLRDHYQTEPSRSERPQVQGERPKVPNLEDI